MKMKEVIVEVRDCYKCNNVYHLIGTEICPKCGNDTFLIDTIKAHISG